MLRGMRSPGTSAMVLLRGMVHAASAVGVNRAELLARVGVSETELERDTSVATATLALAWGIAPQLSRDPLFGLHAGGHAEYGSYDVLDYLFMSSATLGDGCRAIERYCRIVTEIWRIDLQVDGEVARFRLSVPQGMVEPLWHAWDYFFSGSLKRIRAAAGVHISPTAVHFMHGPRDDDGEYERLFRCPVTFDHPINEYVFPSKLLDVTMLSSNPTLHRLVRRHAEELLARVPSDQDLLVRAQTLLPLLLKDPAMSLEVLATQLGVGERNLQRKLAEHGITYKELVDRAREEYALRALEGGVTSIQEIAYELGFNSTASLSRAFKRWRGMSPSEWQTRGKRS
jgi:AraC-like DNA-binding protein